MRESLNSLNASALAYLKTQVAPRRPEPAPRRPARTPTTTTCTSVPSAPPFLHTSAPLHLRTPRIPAPLHLCTPAPLHLCRSTATS